MENKLYFPNRCSAFWRGLCTHVSPASGFYLHLRCLGHVRGLQELPRASRVSWLPTHPQFTKYNNPQSNSWKWRPVLYSQIIIGYYLKLEKQHLIGFLSVIMKLWHMLFSFMITKMYSVLLLLLKWGIYYFDSN